MIPAYAYIRVSGKNQLKGDGPERQETAIRAHAAEHNYSIERIFTDAQTGTTENREQWVEMIALMVNSPIKVVIIERLDRLAREFGIQEYMFLDCKRRGLDVISTHEDDINNPDPTRVLFRHVMGAIAQYDRSMLTIKMSDARKRMRARGEKCEGIYKYGEHPMKPEEKGTLDLMRRLHGDGNNFFGVTKWLNDNRIQSRSGKPWHYNSVQRILQRN